MKQFIFAVLISICTAGSINAAPTQRSNSNYTDNNRTAVTSSMPASRLVKSRHIRVSDGECHPSVFCPCPGDEG